MSTIENTKTVAWVPEDVKISAALFRDTISLLEELDIDGYDSDIVQLFGYVLLSLNRIKSNIDFKQAFTRFFYSEDGHSCFSAHMNSELLSDGQEPF